MLLILSGCGALPRTSTGDEVLDTVLMRMNPFGDCVIVDDQTTIFKDVGGPNVPPGLLTSDSIQNPDARAAATAIAVSYRSFVWQSEGRETHFGNRDGCVMHLSAPVYSGSFAFVDYSSPSGAMGVYVLERRGTRWSIVEEKLTGYW